MRKAWIAAVALGLLFAACSEGSGESTKTPAAATSPTPPAESPTPELGPPPPRPASLDAYPSAVADYLTQNPGAASDCLSELITAWAMPLVQPADACLLGNTDDDPEDELAVVISERLEPPTATSDTRYQVVVLDPSAAGYEVAFQTASHEAVPLGTVTVAPLIAAGDLNGNGVGEIAYETGYCGPDGCIATAYVYEGGGGEYAIVSARDGISIGDGTFDVTDTDGDGAREILATGGGKGTAETGPERPRTEVWAWDGSLYTLRSTLAADSPYLYHRIVDADIAMNGGGYGGAEAAYMAAVENPLAQAWRPDTNELDELKAYALFRAAVAHLMSGGDAETANAYLDRAKGLTNTLHAQLAASFQAGYSAKSEVGVGCGAVQDDLRANDAEYAAFWDFGSDNPAYNPSAICPF